MTAAIHRSGTQALAIPPSQNTAPVLEFNCLYTHDIRKKQKRWNDGFLRFHTFNKRVMLYDVPRNFIGDTHWKAEAPLQDGDEVTLEKGGVVVQVAENIGTVETDLTELRSSKNKRSSEAGSSSPLRATRTPDVRVLNGSLSKPPTQLKHRSLNSLLGSSKGPIGKAALPTKSPFEQRHANVENEEWEGGRLSKRQRTTAPPIWNVTRTTAASPSQPKEKPVLARTSDHKSRTKAPLEAGQQKLGTKEVIDLSANPDEQDGFSSELSSVAPASRSRPVKPQAPTKKSLVRSSSPAFETQKALAPKVPRDSLNMKRPSNRLSSVEDEELHEYESSTVGGRESRQSKDQANRHENDTAKEQSRVQTETITKQRGPNKVIMPASSTGKTLRMAASAPKKKTLLCQDELSKKPSRVHSANTEDAITTLLDTTSQGLTNEKPTGKLHPKSQRKQLQDRLAKINKKKVPEQRSPRAERNDSVLNIGAVEETPSIAEPMTQHTAASELAKLDQMIMPPARPPTRNPPESPRTSEDTSHPVITKQNNASPSRSKRAPGAPVRFTPTSTPSPAKLLPTPAQPQQVPPAKPTAAMPSKQRGKKSAQTPVSLNTRSNGTAAVLLSRPFQALKPPVQKTPEPENAADAWSREAFDLFTWRPPGWDEENWCLKATNVEST